MHRWSEEKNIENSRIRLTPAGVGCVLREEVKLNGDFAVDILFCFL